MQFLPKIAQAQVGHVLLRQMNPSNRTNHCYIILSTTTTLNPLQGLTTLHISCVPLTDAVGLDQQTLGKSNLYIERR